MLKLACLFAFCLTAVVGSASQQRIVGGSLTTISQYPYAAVALVRYGNNYIQNCGSTIINNRSILSAAHCFQNRPTNVYGIRVGSSYASRDGTIHSLSIIFNHPNYNNVTFNNDITVLRVVGSISFGNNVQPGRIAGSNYNLADDQPVWAIGWGRTSETGPISEQLRHVQIRTINQDTCRNIYGSNYVNENVLCAGLLNIGGRSPCSMDSGGPLLHNGVVVGITSFSSGCARPQFPTGFARVSRYSGWVQSNA